VDVLDSGKGSGVVRRVGRVLFEASVARELNELIILDHCRLGIRLRRWGL
jgi:hypothetical protein